MKFLNYIRQNSTVEVVGIPGSSPTSTSNSEDQSQEHLALHTFGPLSQVVAFPTAQSALNSVGTVPHENTFTIVGLEDGALPPKTITLIKILKSGENQKQEQEQEQEQKAKLFRVGKAYIGGFQQWVVWATDEIDAQLQVGIAEKLDVTLPPQEQRKFLDALVVKEVELKRGVLFTDIHRA